MQHPNYHNHNHNHNQDNTAESKPRTPRGMKNSSIIYLGISVLSLNLSIYTQTKINTRWLCRRRHGNNSSMSTWWCAISAPSTQPNPDATNHYCSECVLTYCTLLLPSICQVIWHSFLNTIHAWRRCVVVIFLDQLRIEPRLRGVCMQRLPVNYTKRWDSLSHYGIHPPSRHASAAYDQSRFCVRFGVSSLV